MTGAQRVAKRRAALRAQGLRPRTIWIPDTRNPDFKERAGRSVQWLWDRTPDDAQAMAFIEEMAGELWADFDKREAELKRASS